MSRQIISDWQLKQGIKINTVVLQQWARRYGGTVCGLLNKDKYLADD